MVRMIPWKLPDVQGGSVGGYTPAPTPEPLSNDPYDLDNMVISVDFDTVDAIGSVYRFTFVKGVLSLSGVSILDVSEVGSVIAKVQVTKGTDVWTGAYITDDLKDAEIDVEVGGIMSSAGGSVDVTNKNDYESGKYDVDYLDDFKARISKSSPAPELTSIGSTIEVVSLKVYNGNGVVMQEWTPPEE